MLEHGLAGDFLEKSSHSSSGVESIEPEWQS
jgi:hypothetical protein